MIKNEIYNSLTENQLEILNEVLEGKDMADKKQLSDAIGDLYNMHREENFLEPSGITPEYEEDLNEVERYLKSLGDKEVRRENLLIKLKEYRDFYKKIGNYKDYFNDIHGLGFSYGFTDAEVEQMAVTVGFVFNEEMITV